MRATLILATWMLLQPLVTWAELPEVRVRLLDNKKQINITGFSLKFSPPNSQSQDINIKPVLPVHHKVKLRLRYVKNLPQWVMVDKNNVEKHFFAHQLLLTGEDLRVDGHHVPEKLEVIAKGNKHFDLIASLDLDEYLLGVLPSEMPASWPMQALKAQAVASRSYTLSVMQERKDQHFHVESTVKDQVYKYINHVGAEEAIRKRVEQAINETKDEYLKYQERDVFRAYYHADSAGFTESAKYVWGNNFKGQETKAVKTQISPGPNGIWEVKYSRNYLSQLFSNYYAKEGLILDNFQTIKKGKSGRLAKLQVNFKNAPPKTLLANNLRALIGYGRLKSTNFEIVRKGEWFVFNGRGFGHGVGLCQWGARALAMRGLKYDEILHHYYPNVSINDKDLRQVASDFKTASY